MTTFSHAVGRKFNEDGSVRLFPGVTVVAMLDPSAGATQLLRDVQARLKSLPIASKYAFLPVDSFHITLIDLVCEEVRRPHHWPSILPLDCSLESVDDFLTQCVTPIAVPTQVVFDIERIVCGGIIAVQLRPRDESPLLRYRAAVAQASCLPNEDNYVFHITLAYNIVVPSAEELAQLTLACETELAATSLRTVPIEPQPARLSFFDDMFAFVSESERHLLVSRQTEPADSDTPQDVD